MRRRLTDEGSTRLFSPLIDMVLCMLGAILVLLMVYMYLFNTQNTLPEAIHFLDNSLMVETIEGLNVLYTPQVTGGTGRREFGLTGSLPERLSFDKDTGSIFGVPDLHGASVRQDYVLKMSVSDQAHGTDSTDVTLLVYPGAVPYDGHLNPLQIDREAPRLPDGRVGRAYEAVLGAHGGVEPYEWVITNGQLPPGVDLRGARLAGRPTAAGEYQLTVEVLIPGGTFRYRGRSYEWERARAQPRRYTITVLEQLPASLTITAPTGKVAAPYAAAVRNIGPLLPGEALEWNLRTDFGLTPTAGGEALTGVPTETGDHAVEVRLTQDGETVGTGRATIHISEHATPTIGGVAFQIWESDPEIAYPIPYRGLEEPVTMTAQGEIPAGLSITSAGVLTGRTTLLGVYPIRVAAVDAKGTRVEGSIIIRVGPRF